MEQDAKWLLSVSRQLFQFSFAPHDWNRQEQINFNTNSDLESDS
jgi:hypothetical protein